MGADSLRSLLKSLCNNSLWRYAVFWKLDHQSQMILKWEDGFYDYLNPVEAAKKLSNNPFSSRNEIFTVNGETSVSNEGSCGDPIALAAADMLRHQYTLGQGVVGLAAYTGKHCWVLLDDIVAGYFNPNFITEHPHEWLFQFAVGVKTILLVPVVPHGVVQLGSLEKVSEDLAIVSNIKEKFNVLHADLPSSQLSISMSTATSNVLLNRSDFEDLMHVGSITPSHVHMSALDKFTDQYVCQDMHSEVPELLLHEGSAFDSSMGLTEVSSFEDQWMNSPGFEMMRNYSNLSCLEEDLHAYGYCHPSLGGLEEPPPVDLNSCLAGDAMETPFMDEEIGVAGTANARYLFQIPRDSELLKVFGAAVPGETNGCSWNSSASTKGFHSIDPSSVTQTLTCKSSEFFTERDHRKQFLEAVVGNFKRDSDDVKSYRSNCTLSATVSEQVTTSQAPCLTEGEFPVGANFKHSHMETPGVPRGSSSSSDVSTAASSFKSIASTLTNVGQQNNKQPKKFSNVGRQKCKSGDNKKPRPRDRQMIQDRIKELRVLVPDGAKCSIDGLLHRTVKHMLFLRNVTCQAEKLKHWVAEKVPHSMDHKTSEATDACTEKMSWAVEFGSENEVCPITVKDLKRPGHFLLKMICNDYGNFLEIAQVTRSLKLTILKGAMQNSQNGRWAHFIVEAPRGFHRMDIFWPLMHLLHRNGSSLSARI